MVRWVGSFLRDRRTALVLNGRRASAEPTSTGIPQGSPVSPILFLFFSADLLDDCAALGLPLCVGGFVDDTHLLAYGKSTAENCATLERAHTVCEEWARRHGACFAPAKYSLMHLAKKPRKHDMTLVPRIQGAGVLQPKASMRVLGVELDTRLTWRPHIEKTLQKMTSQALAVTKITASTWGASFRRARHVYSAVVQPALLYGAGIWSGEFAPTIGWRGKPLEKTRKACLQTVAGAYRATRLDELEMETNVPPLRCAAAEREVNFQASLEASGVGRVISESCQNICTTMHRRRCFRACAGQTQHEKKKRWARTAAEWEGKTMRPSGAPLPPWLYGTAAAPVQRPQLPNDTTIGEKEVRKKARALKMRLWAKDQSRLNPAAYPLLGRHLARQARSNLSLHDGLTKAESAVATQLRTRKIGFAHFLYRRGVPGFESPDCPCGFPRQTVEHVLLYCPLHTNGRDAFLARAQSRCIRTILNTARGIRAAAQWVIRERLLPQFHWAAQHLPTAHEQLERG